MLVIEDDPAVRLALEVFLAAEVGVGEVTTAADGDEGVAAAQSIAPDVIVTDSTMPGVSGDGLGRSLRASCPDATIISFSGLTKEAPWADHRIQKGGPDTFDALARAVSGAPTSTPSTMPVETASDAQVKQRKKIHDLRNLLTPVAGYASLLETSAEQMDPEQVRDIAERMIQAVDRVNQLLDKLYD